MARGRDVEHKCTHIFRPLHGGAEVNGELQVYDFCIQHLQAVDFNGSTSSVEIRITAEGNQSFAILKLFSQDIDFKLLLRNKIQKEPLTLSLFLPKGFRQRNLLQERDLRMLAFAYSGLSIVNRKASGRCLLARYLLCLVIFELLIKNFHTIYAQLSLNYL